MKAEFNVKKLKSGVQMKVKGDLVVQYSKEFKQKLQEDLSGEGTFLLSLREVTAMDVSAFQLIVAFKQALKNNDRILSISWPENGPVNELITKAGIKQIMQQ